MSIIRVSESIYIIDTLAFGYENCVASYLIKGDKYALIDVGYASTYRNVINALNKAGIDINDIKYIIPTHVHLDHSGATGHLMQNMKNAIVVAHERAAKHLIDPKRLIESSKEVYGEYILNNYIGLPIPVQSDKIIVVKDELELKLGNLTIKCIYAPGHAPHQITVYIEEMKYLITADSVGIIYPFLNVMIPTTPPPSFNAEQAIDTLNKLSSYELKTLLIPHFGIRNDSLFVFEETKKKIKEYIEIIKNLRNKNLNFDDMLNELIKKVSEEANISPSQLHPYAVQSLRISLMGILNYLTKNRFIF
jgi:Zn-dependent hydrolases, including glyoxylases